MKIEKGDILVVECPTGDPESPIREDVEVTRVYKGVIYAETTDGQPMLYSAQTFRELNPQTRQPYTVAARAVSVRLEPK